MKSTEFHRLLRDALGPAFAAAGFAFVKGANARWSWSEAGRSIRVVFRPNRWGWSEPWGSSFCIDVDESIDGAAPVAANILEIFDAAAMRRFCELRNAVVDKGLARQSGDIAATMAGDAQSELRTLEKLDPPFPYMTTTFPWFDADDLARWGEFLAPRVAILVPQLSQLAAIDAKERRRALHECCKAADARSDEEKAAHRALKSAALARSNAALNTLGDALTRPSARQGIP